MVAIGCGVAAVLLGTAALVYIGRQIFKGRSMVNYEFLNNHHTEVEQASTSIIDMDEVEERNHIKGQDRKHNNRHHHRHHRKYP